VAVDDGYRWERARSRDEQWVLVDSRDRAVRYILMLGPYLGQPSAVYRLYLDEGFTDHPSLGEAKQAGLDSL
jgi:hypothetical protein